MVVTRPALRAAFTVWLAIVTSTALLATAACSGQRPSAHAPAPPAPPEEGAGGAGTDRLADADSSPPSSAAADADKAMQAIIVTAKKWLAADRAVAKNALGYEQAYARHLRDKRALGIERRVPAVLDRAAFTQSCAELAKRHGLKPPLVVFGDRQSAKPVPAVRTEPTPFRYTAGMLFDRTPVTLTVSPRNERALEAFFKTLPSGVGPLVEVVSAELTPGGAVIKGIVYSEAQVTPPRRGDIAATLEKLARKAGVAVPAGHPRLAEVETLVTKHAELLPKVALALEWLAKSHLEGARFDAFRAKVEELANPKWAPTTSRPPPPNDTP